MLSPVMKQTLGVAGIALVLAAVFGVTGDDRTGVVLLLSAAVVAVTLSIASLSTGVRDPIKPPDPARTRVDPAAAGGASAWPVFGALVAGVLAVGAALGTDVVVPGVLAGLVAVGGWLGQTWREHPTWTDRVRERVTERSVQPIGLPVATFLLVAVIAVSMSRVLLAVDKETATAIALVVAVVIMGAFFYVASRPMGPGALVGLAAAALVVTVAGGVVGTASGERSFEPHGEEGEEGEALEVVAEEIVFEQDRIELPAGEEVVISFRNEDAEPHNVAIYEAGEDGAPLFNGAVFSGPETREYRVKIEEPGTYEFRCDIHPLTMTGEVVVD